MAVLYVLLLWLASSFGRVQSELQIASSELVTTLYELETDITEITTVTCSDDADPSAEIIVSLSSVNPSCKGCFQVYPSSYCGGGLGGSYCLQYLPLQQLSYAQTRSYSTELLCTDINTATTATSTVEIRLIPNTPPFFSITNSVSTTLLNTENVAAGGSVYSVTCTDVDSDALDYTLTTVPSSDLFYIDSSGVIRAAEDLSAACLSSITFEVTCTDRRNDRAGPVYIQTALSGANAEPRITGLNFNKDVPEDEAVGTTLATFTVTDDDTPTCLISTSPLNSLQYFELDSITYAVKVKSALDYEQVATRNINISVTCSDGFCTSPVAYLYVRVTQVNEPITLVPSDFTLSTYEGQISLDPNWTPIDEDIDDDPTYTIIGGNVNNIFTINPTTGVITSTIEYDVDGGAMPSTDFLIVQATDEAGHSSTATVSLTILDLNDNRPTFIQGSQTLVVTDCTSTIGSTIGTALVATDQDSSLDGNNVITYSGSNGLITVGSSGNIFVSGAVTAGSTYVLQAVATDAGSGPVGALSSIPHATITVVVTECPTTTTAAPTTAAPTTAAPATTTTTVTPTVGSGGNTGDSVNDNLGWIIFAALLATVFLAALGFMLWQYCYPSGIGGRFTAFCNNNCGDCCTPRPAPRTVQHVRGQPPRNGNAGFWQERYPDDDYVAPPDRDRTPTPAPIEGGRPLGQELTQSWRTRQRLDYA